MRGCVSVSCPFCLRTGRAGLSGGGLEPEMHKLAVYLDRIFCNRGRFVASAACWAGVVDKFLSCL